jgi:hypothetical protein
MVYPVAIAAALLLGVGYVLQQLVAATAPIDDLLRFQLLLDLIRRPLWWAGIACMVVGEVLAGLSLQLASVALVEPLLSTNLLFAVALAAVLAGHRPARTEIGGAILLSGALGAFIGVGSPHGGHAHPDGVPLIVLAVGSVVAGMLVCVAVARRRGLVAESIWLATGAGLLYGLQDAATRAAIVEFDRHGVVAVFDHVWAYVVIGAGTIGIVLSQSAFKAARLDCSLPPITAAEPLVGIALGIGLLGDRVSVSIAGLAVESACLVAMVAGVAMIARSPSLSVGAESCTASTVDPCSGVAPVSKQIRN